MRNEIKQILPTPILTAAKVTRDWIQRASEWPSATFHPARRESIRRLAALKDIHKGERCFIIGNGPSLKNTDLQKLKGEYTFGMNRVYLAFEEWGFTTSYLVAVNSLVIEQCAADFLAQPMPVFLSWRSNKKVPGSGFKVPSSGFRVPSVNQVPGSGFQVPVRMEQQPSHTFSRETKPSTVPISNPSPGTRNLEPGTSHLAPVFLHTSYTGPRFSPDARGRLWEGATVTFVCLQLAFHMGFETVILIGVDHSFKSEGTPNTTVTSQGDDPDHFNPGYFGKGFRWQLPDLDTSEIGYQMARQAYNNAGRRILDATVGGKLAIFEKVQYPDLFTE